MKSADTVKTSAAKVQTKQGETQPFFQKEGAGSAFSSGKAFFSVDSGGTGSFFSANTSAIQAQLTVGAPDDPYEQEAEKVSRQVVEGFDSASSIQRKISTLGLQTDLIQPMPIGTIISRRLQRTPIAVQAKCDDCAQEEQMAQPKSLGIQFAGEGAMVPPDLESRIQSQRGGGAAMDVQTKSAMESNFGADFGGVRVHTGSPAVQMSKQLNAHAFTVGNDIFFNQGRYQPHTKEGAGLLSHELTHTVQQGASVQNKRINRLPFGALSNHAAAHLSAMNASGMQTSLSRKEIAQLQAVPQEEMKMQQLQMLQMKGVDKVQKTGNVGIMRSCFGGGSTPVTPTMTHKTNFAAPDGTAGTRKKVGIGEKVVFTGNTVGDWTANEGTPRILNGKNKFEWTAPERAKAAATIKFSVGGNDVSEDMEVIEPTHYVATKDNDIAIPPGIQGAGMILNFNFHPQTVSFGNTKFKEVSHPATNVSGYYLPYINVGKTIPGTLFHNTGDQFNDISQDNKIDGGLRDEAAQQGYPAPWKLGGFDWSIPNRFKLKTEAGDGKEFPNNSMQTFVMSDATGKTTITKGGEKVERTP
ncbi:MAG: DUF4157 domain-containing protein [Saprospiraceae bacterium]